MLHFIKCEHCSEKSDILVLLSELGAAEHRQNSLSYVKIIRKKIETSYFYANFQFLEVLF